MPARGSFTMAIVSSENIGTLVLILIPLIVVMIKKHKSLNTKKIN